jgi:transposase
MKKLIDDELRAIVERLLPTHPSQPKGARPWVDDRAALTGIVFVLKSGIPWTMWPAELGYGAGEHSLESRHAELKHLLNLGLINKDDYEAKKAALLDSL